MYKRIIALFSCFVILFSCVPFAHAEYASDNQGANFWDWAMIYGNKYGSGTSISGVVQAVTGWMSGKVCSLSPDSYHHSDVKPNAFGNGGRDDSGSYVWCTCKYCGDQFKLYTSIDTDHGGGFGKSDLQQSYEAQVEELPATGYQSDGSLLYTPSHKYLSFKVASDIDCGHYVGSSTTYVSATFDCDADLILIYPGNGSSDFQCQSYKGFFSFVAPVSGTYYVIKTPCRTGYYIDSSGAKYDVSTNWPENNGVHYSAGYSFDDVNSYSGLKFYKCLYMKMSPRVYRVVPDVTLGGDIYNINSRPTSITGDYGIIGDNGQIIKVEGDKIVNETNNTYYNPSTGETTTITDWSYNYEDRSYTVTTESGDTVTITYGDENVVIKEGDTTYNVYYLVDGSGSETPDPGPDVPPACNHQWTETSTTPATCTVPGSRILTCSLCTETKTETIPAPGHKWTIKQEVKNEYDENGNQTQEGYAIWECSVCGEQQKTTDGTAPPGGGSGTGSGSSGGVFSGIFGLLVDFLGFFWNTFRDFVGEGVKGFLNALMDGTSSIFGLLNPFNWGG